MIYYWSYLWDWNKDREFNQISNLKTVRSANRFWGLRERDSSKHPILKQSVALRTVLRRGIKIMKLIFFWKKTQLLLRKSPWPAWGQIAPILAKVGSAPDLGQPLLDFLNRPFKKLGEAGQPPKSTPHSKLDRGWPRSGALPTLARMGAIWPHAGQGDFLNSSLIFFKKISIS